LKHFVSFLFKVQSRLFFRNYFNL